MHVRVTQTSQNPASALLSDNTSPTLTPTPSSTTSVPPPQPPTLIVPASPSTEQLPNVTTPVGPGSDFTFEPKNTVFSPDKTLSVEQYSKLDATSNSYSWEFWIREGNHLSLLNEEPNKFYPAGFRFTNDLQWLIRMQKTGAGEGTLFLYRKTLQGFVAATSKPLGELAWDYFNSLPDSESIIKPDFHKTAMLIKGVEDNYRWLGESWPDNRYLVIGLSGEVYPNSQHGQLRPISGWRCVYDLQSNTFSVPNDFADNNAKALAPPVSLTVTAPPTPVIAPSAPPVEVSANKPDANGISEDSLNDFLKAYWQANLANDATQYAGNFASQVNYCYKETGMASRDFVEEDREKLIQAWPTREMTETSLTTKVNGQDALVDLGYNWHYSGVKGSKNGTCALKLSLAWNGTKWEITSYYEKVKLK